METLPAKRQFLEICIAVLLGQQKGQIGVKNCPTSVRGSLLDERIRLVTVAAV